MACNVEMFTWSITNFSLCPLKDGEYLASPPFLAETLQRTRWCLKLYPKGCVQSENFLSCFLRRVDFLKEPYDIKIDFSILIRNGTQSQELGRSTHTSFRCHQGMGFAKLMSLEDLFKKKEGFLQRDTLTLQCCLWLANGKPDSPTGNMTGVYSMDFLNSTMEEHSSIVSEEFPSASNRHSKSYFTTRIPVDRHCVTWTMKGFQTTSDLKRSAIVSSNIREKSELVLTCYTKKDPNLHTWLRIDIERKDLDMRQMMLKAKVSVSNNSKSVYSSEEDQHLFGDCPERWEFPPLVNLSQINISDSEMSELFFQCDFQMLFKDEQLTLYRNRLQSMNSTVFSDYNSDMGRMLLDIGSGYCKEHPNFLCSHSPLFRVLCSDGANVRNTSINVDPNTLMKMIAYLFNTEFISEYDYEDVKKLYSVATKCEIIALKKKCVSFLKCRLEKSNVCDVLSFAKLHGEDDLMKSVLMFLQQNREIFQTAEWDELMKDNSQLTGEIMKKLLTMKD